MQFKKWLVRIEFGFVAIGLTLLFHQVLWRNVQAEYYSKRAYEHYKKLEYKAALRDCDKALSISPTHGRAHNVIGNVYADKNNFEKAVEEYTIAIRYGYEKAYYNRGREYLYHGDYDKAIEDESEAIRINPRDYEAYNYRGLAYEYSKNGSYANAIADYSEAIRLNPKDAKPYANQGRAEFSHELERARTFDSTNFFNSRFSQQTIKIFKKSIKDFSDSISLDPKCPECYALRGQVFAQFGNYKRAVVEYSKAIRLDPKSEEYYTKQGLYYSLLHRHTNAIKVYTEAIHLNPKNADTYAQRGDDYAETGKSNLAIRDIVKCCGFEGKSISTFVQHQAASFSIPSMKTTPPNSLRISA